MKKDVWHVRQFLQVKILLLKSLHLQTRIILYIHCIYDVRAVNKTQSETLSSNVVLANMRKHDQQNWKLAFTFWNWFYSANSENFQPAEGNCTKTTVKYMLSNFEVMCVLTTEGQCIR